MTIDEVARVDVRGIGRLVLAHQQARRQRGQSPQGDPRGIQHVPPMLDLGELRAVGLLQHLQSLQVNSGWEKFASARRTIRLRGAKDPHGRSPDKKLSRGRDELLPARKQVGDRQIEAGKDRGPHPDCHLHAPASAAPGGAQYTSCRACAASGIHFPRWLRPPLPSTNPGHDHPRHVRGGGAPLRPAEPPALRQPGRGLAPEGGGGPRAFPPGAEVLDLCCGTGDQATRSAPPGGAGGGGRLLRADARHRPAQVREDRRSPPGGARRRRPGPPLPRPPLPGATVSFGLRNVADLDAALRQLAGVLRPGGKLVVLECAIPALAAAQGALPLLFPPPAAVDRPPALAAAGRPTPI